MSRILLLAFLIAATGCISHSIYLPNQTLHTPSTSGKLGAGSVLFGAGADTRFTVVDNYVSNPPVEEPEIGKCQDDFLCLFVFQGQGAVGLHERLDLVLGPSGFGAKFQLVGKSEAQGWKASVQYTGTNRTKSQTTNTDSIETKATGVEPGLSIGYQTDTGMVVYLAYHHLKFVADSTIVNSGGNFSFLDRSGSLEKLGLGVTTEKRGWFGAIEGTLTRANFEGAEEFTDGTFGFWGGYQW